MPEASSPDTPSARGAWARRSVWTVADQALFAGANFLVNIVLARWLSPEAYGAFSVAFVVFLLAGAIHGGLFVEPMLVFGAGRFQGRTRAYLRTLLHGHLAFSLVVGAALAVVGAVAWYAGGREIAVEFVTLGVVAGLILALWLLRRACYLVDRPDWAAGAGVLYMALLLGGAWALGAGGWLSGPAVLVLMAGGSVAASAVLAWRLGLFRPDDAVVGPLPDTLRADVREAHSAYGRWSAPTGGLEWLHSALPLLVLPLVVGLEASGALRALYNLAMPALHAFAALTVMALPVFVRARAAGRARETARNVGGGIVALGVLYGAALLVGGRPVVEWLYDGKYPVTDTQLWLLAVLPVVAAASGVAMAWLRSDERPRAVFKARALAVGAAGTVGVALTSAFGVAGALASDLVALGVELIAQLRAMRPWGAVAKAPRRSAPPAADDRLRVLMSAFACYPGAGSEPAVGWNHAVGLAASHDVWVLTYAGWRERVEAHLAAHPVPGLHVVYVAVPFESRRHLREGTHRSGIAEQLHYLLWQAAARRVARRLHRRVGFDLAHHVTFVKYWTPTAVDALGIPFVWGTVGGGESTPDAFYGALGPEGVRYERTRDAARALSERLPGVRAAAARSTVAFATTDETADRLTALGARDVRVRSAIGLSADEVQALARWPLPDGRPPRFLCLGRLIAFKGYTFAVEAFARAVAEAGADPSFRDAELWVVGDGPERAALEAQAARLGVGARVRFTGNLPREAALDVLATATALVHPTLHDSGGGVCLEALAAGRPVIGLALGGTAVHVGPGCGLLISPETPAQVVADLARAMRRLAAHPDEVRAMGTAGRAFVADHFTWEAKLAATSNLYRTLVAPARPAPPDLPGDGLPGAVPHLALRSTPP